MPDDVALKKCIDEMRLIINARTNILTGPDGSGTMIVDATNVDLNGIGDHACEPFVFPGDLGFNFCKTEGEPYDAVVTACLLVARDHFPSSVLSIDSDGDWSKGDWHEGIDLYSSVLERQPQYPMSPGWQVVGWRDYLYGDGIYALLMLPLFLPLLLGFFWFRRRFRRR